MSNPTGFHSDSTDSYEDLVFDTVGASDVSPVSETTAMDQLKKLADDFARLNLKHVGTTKENNYSRISEGVSKALAMAQQWAVSEDEELKTRFQAQIQKVAPLMQDEQRIQIQEIVAAF